MRDSFIRTLTAYAERNRDIYLLTGDLGFSVFEDFAKEFPERFINVGIAEANMIGVASGLALSGKTAVTYSIIPFSISRCLEQIKIDVAYQKADVKIVGVGAGYAYGTLGITHHAIEDISIVRSYPNMNILSPCDANETRACLELALKTKGPFYLRLGKNRGPDIHAKLKRARLGGSNVLRSGRDVTIFVTGSIAKNVMDAALILSRAGIEANVISMYSLKPLDERAVLNACTKTGVIITVEEHTILGGLGSAVSEIIAESGINGVRLKRIGIPDVFCEKIGNRDYLLNIYGLSSRSIADVIYKCVKKKNK